MLVPWLIAQAPWYAALVFTWFGFSLLTGVRAYQGDT